MRVDETPETFGKIVVSNFEDASIIIGARVTLNALNERNTLESRGPVILKTIQKGAVLQIGAGTGISSSTISASFKIVIGRDVLIGSGVIITDSDHHLVDIKPGQLRRPAGLPISTKTNAIEICDNSFIGARSIILKGVRIGVGSVVAAGSVVTRDVPDYSIAAGNPARVVRQI